MASAQPPNAAAVAGHFVSWGGGCLFIGERGNVVPLHAHYAIQIAFGPERPVGFRTSQQEPWTWYDGAIIPSRQPHEMNASAAQPWAILFVEPETREGRAITELYLRDGIASMPEEVLAGARDSLFGAWRERRNAEAFATASQRVVRALAGDIEPTVVSDERILRAIAYINANLAAPLTLEEVAAEAYLSPSRFRHLFVEQTGMGLRPYVLWRRFLRAWELVMDGESLSAAAHGAGFADAAHLSRTSRRMFGFPPSAMQRAGPLPKSAPSFK